jgi:hypothetical protein
MCMTSDVAIQGMYMVLAIVIQMRHDVRDVPKDYWSTIEHFYTLLYCNMMNCN